MKMGWRPALAAAAAALTMLVLTPVSSAQQSWPLWRQYSDHFLDAQGRVIDRSAQDRTTSEGQAYAMFFALVANDRPRFERLLAWTAANLAHGDLTLRLPAWLWGRSKSGEWKTLDENSASDADLWMAYTLLQAGRLWHETRYETLGRVLASRIAHEEVKAIPGFGTALLPGAHGFRLAGGQYILNPSYVPLPLIAGMAQMLPEGPWAAIHASLPALLSQAPGQGFAMDWLQAGPEGIKAAAPPAEPAPEPQGGHPAGSFDAIRVYLWLGIADPATPGLDTLMSQMSAMATYLRDTLTPPLEVDPQGKAIRTDAPVGFSAAVEPYLSALGMKQQARLQQDRVAASRQPGTGLYGQRADYYDQNLVLFSTGWSEERYHFTADGKLRVNWK